MLYIAVAVVAVGALPFDELKGAARRRCRPCSRTAPGFDWAGNIISFGALVAITSVVLTILYGQTRIMFAMCRDGLMPRQLREGQPTDAHARSGSPRPSASLIAVLAAFVPLSEIVKLVNIGTLFAFIVVNIGVIILRRTQARPRARLPRPVRAGASRSSARCCAST